MWRCEYNPRTKEWDVTEDDAGAGGGPGHVAAFECEEDAREACAAVNARRGIRPDRRTTWEATA